MKIFLDVGGHLGETLRVVQNPRWGFDRIYSFEPAPDCWPALERVAGPRTEILHFGLWDRDGTILLHNPGAIGASMSADKEGVTSAVPCEFRDAGAWFQMNVADTDEVYAKINAEGAEVEIIERLATSGQLERIDHLLIHFDAEKIPSRRHLVAETRERLDEAGTDYQSAADIQFGGVIRGTRNWLRWCHSTSRRRDVRYKTLSKLGHVVRRRLYPLKKFVRRVLHSRSALDR
ncbi:hypothetical protein [Geodermatophilus sp. SYSU D00815]